MDLDLLSKKYKELNSPLMDFSIHGNSGNSFDNFIELLKTEDAKSKKILRRFNIVYTIVAVFYFLLTIANPDPGLTLLNRLAGGCYVLAFIIFVWMLRRMYTKIKNVDYSISPAIFLQEAKERFSLWTKQQLPLIPFLILINVGASISLTKYLNSFGIKNGLLLFQIFFLVLIVFGFYMGKRDWKKNKQPLFIKISKLLEEFED